MPNPLAPETVAWGCTYTPAQVAPGQLVFRLIHAEGPLEWGGRHSIFVEVLNLDEQRMTGIEVKCWNGGEVIKSTDFKPGEPFALDFPMYAMGNAYGVMVRSNIASDSIFGFGLPDHKPHHVFKLVWQLTVESGLSEPPGPLEPVPPPSMSAQEAIRRAQNYLAQAGQLLDYALGRLPQ